MGCVWQQIHTIKSHKTYGTFEKYYNGAWKICTYADCKTYLKSMYTGGDLKTGQAPQTQ